MFSLSIRAPHVMTCPQEGCTSPSAMNFSESALFDDGSCLFTNPYMVTEIEFQPPYDWSMGETIINTGDDISVRSSVGFDFNFFGSITMSFG